MEKRLAKIESVYFGHGGYQDVMIGLHFNFSGHGWGVGFSEDAWDSEMVKWSESCKWTEENRNRQYADMMRKISLYLKQAKVSSIDKLKGIPVEIIFENSTMKEWRILTEVL